MNSLPAASAGTNETGVDSRAGKYLTFELDNTEFAIEILRVVEILKMMEITAVPCGPRLPRGRSTCAAA